jgi:AraC-like DNA-binding protein
MATPLVRELIEYHVARQRGPILVPQHLHHFCQMDLILGGRMVLLTPSERIILKPGDGLLIPPLCRHGFEITTHVHHASFKLQLHPRYTTLPGGRPRVVRLPRQTIDLARIIYNVPKADHPLAIHDILALATLGLTHLLHQTPPSASSSPPADSPELWKLLGDVIANPHAGWTVQQLADRSGLSEGHFTKLFIRSFNQTPRRFLLESRIRDAADRLNRDGQSIKSIARDCGYATVHSFTRAFKRALGIAPAAYVKSQGRL